MKALFLVCLTFATLASASIVNQPTDFKDKAVQQLLQEHLQKYGTMESFSAIQASIKVKDELSTYVTGHRDKKPDSPPIDANSLFDIGSITKSFTAAIALLAESDSKLKLTTTLSTYLPQYPHWGDVSIMSLMDMSSGLPNYSDAPKINYFMSKNLRQYWSQDDLINLVYFKEFNPPRKPGFFYSNTGYILMDKILSKAYNTPFQTLIIDKIIHPLNLKNTFYPIPEYPANVLPRLVRGYSYNVYDNPELLGQDVTENNLSWAGAAGAIVANSEDVVHWVEHLFIENKLLTKAQQEKMQRLISTSSGLPISATTEQNPYGFGLGIIQGYDAKIGRYWFYEGETLGYRAVYMYVPCNRVIIATLFNSATNHDNDHSRELILKIYNHLLETDEMLICGQDKMDV
ncbi:serine hydrolase domain-containing protein [Legionella clemsonensis]|uniref:D-alanyl-D-alanine carboxypeptidase n=1 Tax=Legionella clemsonensis TaxID=1867846 RepID=A0A222P677_9GAMM|nr:serine hydrolase domain-containing protein [Legionella clemsonensis]ASQ47348.1 D-alanyl-D-alanine carboxypeptidase precursor [Legionella clemsonensis]